MDVDVNLSRLAPRSADLLGVYPGTLNGVASNQTSCGRPNERSRQTPDKLSEKYHDQDHTYDGCKPTNFEMWAYNYN